MTSAAGHLHAHSRASDPAEPSAAATIRLIPAASRGAGNPDRANHGHSPGRPRHRQAVRPWPLLILALPAAIAVWSG